MKDRVKFFRTGLFNRQTGAIVRSSRYVVKDVLNVIGDQKLNCVVEYGPGDGVMTRALLKRLASGGVLLAVEANPNFLKVLQNIHDPRLRLLESTIQEVSSNLKEFGIASPDLIVSSIPFSSLKPAERDLVIKDSKSVLGVGGKLIIFHQYSRLMVGPMRKYFPHVSIKLEPRNFLPCFIISAIKG